jgi:predicted alpha/beta-fold hydrolase
MNARDFLTTSTPFVPRPWASNGHAMTVFAWARPRAFPDLPPPEARLFRTAPDTQVLAHCYWQPARAQAPALVVLHGLEGSSQAHYMRGLAAKAWRRGWNAVLLNQRNCGGTEHLTPSLYHSGLTEDPRTVIRSLVHDDGIGAVGVIGYSLGGNLTMKLAAELSDAGDLPLAGVVGISPTIDLETCVRAIERRSNVVYQFNFVRNLKARLRRKALVWPGRYDLRPLGSVWTIRKFDEIYTAPSHGYLGASDYYHRASAIRVVDHIRVPALILTAADDPFVPAPQFEAPAISANPHIVVRVERHGGHCGFASLPDSKSGDDGYWAETTAIEFLARTLAR